MRYLIYIFKTKTINENPQIVNILEKIIYNYVNFIRYKINTIRVKYDINFCLKLIYYVMDFDKYKQQDYKFKKK